MIENLIKQRERICLLLTKSLDKYNQTGPISLYNPDIMSSGIVKFEKTKTYLDTSSINGVNDISNGETVSFLKRPSRANMQPLINSVWFAKMKSSYKNLIITENDEDIISSTILSTGFLGIKASNQFPLSLITAILLSQNFQKQRDSNSVGTTMAGINNETFLKIQVPILSSEEIANFNHRFSRFTNRLSRIRIEINNLKTIKKQLLLKYF